MKLSLSVKYANRLANSMLIVVKSIMCLLHFNDVEVKCRGPFKWKLNMTKECLEEPDFLSLRIGKTKIASMISALVASSSSLYLWRKSSLVLGENCKLFIFSSWVQLLQHDQSSALTKDLLRQYVAH